MHYKQHTPKINRITHNTKQEKYTSYCPKFYIGQQRDFTKEYTEV